MKVEIEVSARHIHLSKSDYDFLFGSDCDYKVIKELSQTGEFASDKIVKIIGPENELKARFLGPFRDKTQVEVSKTDCYFLGIEAPYEVEVSDQATEIKIAGDSGEITRKSAIIAFRHLHCNPKEAADLQLSAGQHIKVKTKTERGMILYDDVIIKVADNYNLRVHLDTDEGNASGINDSCFGDLLIENGSENDFSR